MRLLAWCLMENHWHSVAWPRKDGELTGFFRWSRSKGSGVFDWDG